ncbi:MAG TPA: carboxypeptidase-like regulatory domain-containing protein [Bryobacteraceae bacterium]|nr:carboxypeptidase-like regulatory domain-containing protein [Bryobacteraceae bacterium]
MKRPFCKFRVWAIISILLTCHCSFGQSSSGQINGVVEDPTGAIIPGAAVKLVNELNASERTTTTNEQGNFVFPSLPPGTYDLNITARGFKNFSVRHVVLSASDQLSAGILRMQVGAESQSVTVQADVTPVQTESGERSALIDEKQMATLLTPNRDFLNFTRVLPGVVATGTEGQDQLGIFGMDTVNGQRSEYSTVSMDGVIANTNINRLNRVTTAPNADSLSETKVLTNNYQAEDGGASGASIDAVTKSGTQSFHGSIYYFKRHEEFNANDYFNSAYWNGTEQPKSQNRFNTIGYNIGGPVLIPGTSFNKGRNKMFFFFSQEIWPTVHPGDGNPLRLRVPTADERKGIFSTPVINPSTGQPFPNNTLTGINPDMQKLLNLLPLPTPGYSDPSGKSNYIVNLTEHNPVNQQLLRLDYNIGPKWHTYIRGLRMSVGSKGNAANAMPMEFLQSFPVDYLNDSSNVIWNLTYIASPTLVNELNVGYAGWSENQQLPNGNSELSAVQKSALGITLGQFQPQLNPLGLIPTLKFGGGGLTDLPNIGFPGSNGARFPISSQSYSYGINDGITKTWQNHISKAGLYLHIDRFVEHHVAGNFDGLYDFSVNTQNPLDTGNTFANELLGNFYQYSESTSAPDFDPGTRVLEWYLQDSWKIKKTFTLNYGVRLSYDLAQTVHIGANFVPSTYDKSQTPVLYHPGYDKNKKVVAVDPRNGNTANAQLIGAAVPGSGNPFDGMVTLSSTNPVEGQGLSAAPRIGFAWDVFGDGKTSIRGGGGVYYQSRTSSALAGSLTTNPPIEENPIHPFGTVSQLLSSPDNSVIFPGNLSGALQKNGKWPVFYDYSLGIQRAIGYHAVLDVAYVGNLGRHLGQTLEYNALPPGTRFISAAANQDPTNLGKPLADNFLRPYTGLGSIPFTESGGTSNYNSLQISVTRRFTHGFSIGGNYVWSKALDYTDATTGIALPTFAPRHAYSYGLANYDRDHSVVVNWLWNIPAASNLWDSFVTRQVFDNWQVSGIASFVRGAPYGITLNTGGVDLTGGSDGPRALLTGKAPLPHGKRNVLQYFNTNVVNEPAANAPNSSGQYSNFVGNAGKVVFRGPGENNWDVALFKNIPIKERVTIQIRTEFYNLFNHPSFNSVDNEAIYKKLGAAQSNDTFGELNGDAGARQIQLSGRLNF